MTSTLIRAGYAPTPRALAERFTLPQVWLFYRSEAAAACERQADLITAIQQALGGDDVASLVDDLRSQHP